MVNGVFMEYYDKVIKSANRVKALEELMKIYKTNYNDVDDITACIQQERDDAIDDVNYRLKEINKLGKTKEFLDYYVDWA